MDNNLLAYLRKFNIEPKDKQIYNHAFIHRSYLNEHPEDEPSNERLEFLGDAVLELLTTEFLYQNLGGTEGDLSSIRAASVRTTTLAIISQRMGLADHLKLSKGEEITGGREKVGLLADLFEAFLGAVYLDQGFDKAKELFDANLLPYIKDIIKNKKYIDPKTYLQEITQEKFKTLPEYKILEESGPDHNKIFKIAVGVNNKILGEGEGPSKQQAQEEAARSALHKLEQK
jgi:ribonuclease-3